MLPKISKIAHNKTLHNFMAYLGASLIMMVLNLASNPWIAKNMSPEDYAITGYYSSFAPLISPIINFYMIHFFIKEYFKIDNERREILFATIAKALIWFSAIISIICFFAILGYIVFIDTDFSLPIFPYLALSVFSLPLTGLMNLQLAKLRMEKSPRPYFYLSLTNGIIAVTLSIILVVFLKWGAFGKLLATFSCNLIIFLYLAWNFRNYIRTKIPLGDYTPIFKFCLPLAASAMLGYFTSGFSTTYLESLGNNYEYGFYVVGVSIGGYLTVFSSAIGNTFQPDLYESTIKRQWKRYTKFCLLQLGSIGSVVAIFILLAPFIISILTAGRYVGSTGYAQVIALSTFTSAIYFLINNFTISTDRPRLYLYTTVLGSIGIVIAMPFMTSRFGYIGGCWVMVGSYLLFALINLVLLRLNSLFKKNPAEKT